MDKKIEGMIPDDYDKSGWHCIKPKFYVFGVVKNVELKRVITPYAAAERQADGSWNWKIANTRFQGSEPSRKRAIKAVRKTFEQAIKIKREMK